MYGLLVGPVTIALAQTNQGHSFVGTSHYLWRNRRFENGPMWFAEALLIFTVFTVLCYLIAGLLLRLPGLAAIL